MISQVLLLSAWGLFLQKKNWASVGPLETQYLEMSPLGNETSLSVFLSTFGGMKEDYCIFPHCTENLCLIFENVPMELLNKTRQGEKQNLVTWKRTVITIL